MGQFFNRRTCLAVLIVFITSFGTASFHPKWIAHELEHLVMVGGMGMDDGHDHDESDTGSTNDAEHGAMHAVVQLASVPSPGFPLQNLPPAGVIRSPQTDPPVAPATLGAPFRPPRA